MKANIKNIIIFILVVGVVIVGSSFFMGQNKDEDKFLYSDLIDLFEKDLVKDFVVDENATITLNAYVVKVNNDGSYDFELDSKGERKVQEYTYTFSYELQLEKIVTAQQKMLSLVRIVLLHLGHEMPSSLRTAAGKRDKK